MNILMFNYEYPPLGGGGGVAHSVIAEELARRHRVVVVTSGTHGLPKQEERAGVEIRRVRVPGRGSRSVASLSSMLGYPPAAWWEAARVVRDGSFDVINSHFAVPTGPASLPVARIAGIPHVLSIHGGDIYDPSKRLSPHRWAILRRIVSGILEGSDEVVAQSENTRSNAYQYFSYKGPIHVIPLGIHFPSPPTVSRDVLGIPSDRFVLITVGRLVSRKAVDRLIRIMAELRGTPAHLIVVGAGPELEPLKGLSRQLGVSDWVVFTGWVSEERKWELLRAADAYVSTSLHEGFGLVFLEGMAMGLPVIAPDHGGQVDFLVDGETGYVTPAGDDAATRKAIAALMDSPSRVKRMGKRNLARVDEYRAQRCAERYEALFEGLVATRKSASRHG